MNRDAKFLTLGVLFLGALACDASVSELAKGEQQAEAEHARAETIDACNAAGSLAFSEGVMERTHNPTGAICEFTLEITNPTRHPITLMLHFHTLTDKPKHSTDWWDTLRLEPDQSIEVLQSHETCETVGCYWRTIEVFEYFAFFPQTSGCTFHNLDEVIRADLKKNDSPPNPCRE